MSRAVLFCNGEIKDLGFHKSLLREDDFIIAVDGGGNYCHQLGILPSVAIGDFDSIDQSIKNVFDKENVEIVPFPMDKDYIDMILGIEEAIDRGFSDILILGAMGGKRADMFLGNAIALSLFDKNIVMQNEYCSIRYLGEGHKIDIYGSPGDYVSLIPLSDTLKTGISDGLKYQLNNLTFRRGETRSISNEFLKDSAKIRIEKGEALIIVQSR